MLEACVAFYSQIESQPNRERALVLFFISISDDDQETGLNHAEEAVRLAQSAQPYDAWTYTEVLWVKAYTLFASGSDDLAYETAETSVSLRDQETVGFVEGIG